ncbi:MAG: PAS domain S-box protein, partial [Methanoregulaceae archaeon]|nr:PAS domain S-box protein [Methanoregulaceae archaeon]
MKEKTPPKTPPVPASSPGALRSAAEERLQARPGALRDSYREHDLRALVHELEVHQIELEMQNEELQRTKQDLEQSERKYRDLFDFAPVGYLTLAGDGTILEVNLAGAALIGETRAGLVNRRFPAFVDQESIPVFTRFCEQVLASGEKQVCTVRLRDHRSSPVDVQIVGRAVTGETGSGDTIRAMFIDVSERLRLEEALRESSQYLENLINHANTPIVVWAPDYRITRFNQAFERLTGRSSRDVVNRSLDILFSKETKDKSMALIHRAMAGELWEIVEIPIAGEDGAVRTVLWNSAPVYGKDGKSVISVIAQGQDVTEIKRHEENQELVAEELRRSNLELEQFAYVASHDLREPLRMVTSFSELLSQRYSGKLDTDADEYIGFIVDGAERMATLIDDLLEFSRVAHGRQFESVDLSDVAGEAINNLKAAIRERNVTISYEPLPTVMADRGQMVQLFQNLVANSIKFCPSDREPVIQIGAVRDGDEWKFSVKDNGIGIDPAFKEKIFVIFQRLHGRGEYPGTGIGLAICRRIVERHGGRIWVESEEGDGSTFFFTIPGS